MINIVSINICGYEEAELELSQQVAASNAGILD